MIYIEYIYCVYLRFHEPSNSHCVHMDIKACFKSQGNNTYRNKRCTSLHHPAPLYADSQYTAQIQPHSLTNRLGGRRVGFRLILYTTKHCLSVPISHPPLPPYISFTTNIFMGRSPKGGTQTIQYTSKSFNAKIYAQYRASTSPSARSITS